LPIDCQPRFRHEPFSYHNNTRRVSNICYASQGELFETVLTSAFFKKLHKSSGTLWIWTPPPEEDNDESYHHYDVCIKATSRSVHRLLVHPSHTRMTFRGLHCAELSEVLLCVWSRRDSSIVTIMRDLRKDPFQNLEPCSFSKKMDALWDAFRSLVKRILLALAQENVVHCDLQPGWDYTANIMVKEEINDGTVELRLIDYDSLVLIYTCPEIPMNRQSFHVCHDEKRSGLTALDYLWWQCVLIGSTWLGRTKYDAVDAEKFVTDCQDAGKIRDYFPEGLNDDDYLFFNEIVSGKEVTTGDIDMTLDCLAKAFCQASCRKHVHCQMEET